MPSTQQKLENLKHLSCLYIDDDPRLLEYMDETLKYFFKSVYTASSCVEGLKIFENLTIHAILVDNRMPLMSGIEFVQTIRKQHKNIPIVFVSNYKDVHDLLEVIKLNVIEYCLKPLSFETLQNVLIRISESLHEQGVLQLDLGQGRTYFPLTKIVTYQNEIVELTKKELLFLEYLIAKKREVATIEELSLYVWNGEMTRDTLRNLVNRLRQKLGKSICTNIHNIGYKLE